MIYILLFLLLFWWSPFISSNINLDEVFTYNHIALIYLRRRSYINEFKDLTINNHLFIHNYIISLLNNILRYISMV